MTIAIEEFEIKLLFPGERLKDIEAFLIANGGARRQHLLAFYIDTPDFLLTKSGIAFRIRKEGRQWIQTLKASTANVLERLEHNVVISGDGKNLPSWDINLHQKHKAGKLLKKVLSKSSGKDLKIVYQTDIWRRKALVNTDSGCIEYALDCGSVFTEGSSGLVEVFVQEIEVELKNGSPEVVFHQAKEVIRKFDAYIDTRSKSERGFLLAQGLRFKPPQKVVNLSLKNVINKHEIICILVNSCMTQILNNQSVLNLGHNDYSEYLHQLRIGLRRLKVVFKYLGNLNDELSLEGVDSFKTVFKKLGQYRDNHFVSKFLNPILLTLGGSEVKLGGVQALPHPASITKDINFQLFLLEAMFLGRRKSQNEMDAATKLDKYKDFAEFKSFINTQFTKNFKSFSEKISQFSDLDDYEIHDLRKKMKFIRYSLEFFKDYLSKKRFEVFYKRTSALLQHFGFFNDICVSIERIELLVEADPNLLFALGWLKAEREWVKTLCHKSAKSLLKCEVPWAS